MDDKDHEVEAEQESEEIVEVEPEIVYFTDDAETNISDEDQQDDQNIDDDDDDGEDSPTESQIMPVMPFDLSSSYIYLIGDTDVDLESDLRGDNYNDEEFEDDADDNTLLGESTPRCDVCDENFPDSRNLKLHYENFHVKSKNGAYCCHICKKSFDSSALLQEHDQTPCTNRKKIRCKECGSEFASTYLYSHHFKIEHEKKLVCVVCQKVHTSEAALLHHLQVHDQSKYSCDKCDVKCETIYELISHDKTHSKALLYACNKCNAAFSEVTELAFHIRQMHGRAARKKKILS